MGGNTRLQVCLNLAMELEIELHHSESQLQPWLQTEKDTSRIEDLHQISTLTLCLQLCMTLVSFQNQKLAQWLSTTSPGQNGWRLPTLKSHEMNDIENVIYVPQK